MNASLESRVKNATSVLPIIGTLTTLVVTVVSVCRKEASITRPNVTKLQENATASVMLKARNAIGASQATSLLTKVTILVALRVSATDTLRTVT